MPIFRRAFAWLAAVILLPAAAQPTHVQVTEPLRLVGPLRAGKGGEAVYIVKLRQPGAASYKSVPTALTAEKPSEQARASRAAAAESYAKQLEQSHDRLLAGIGATSEKLYSYRYSVNGFAARLTAAQVSRLAQSAEVERIWQDTDQHLRTNNSSAFLGLQDPVGGLRADLGLRGENIVVGVIDSGIAPNHPSLLDTEDRTPRTCRSEWSRSSILGLWLCMGFHHKPPTEVVYDPPIGFTGTCQAGPGFEPTFCNNKVVGARFYLDGFLAQHELDPGEVRSPKDVDGHGTHIATIVAGNSVTATLLGTRIGRVSGIAPRARIAVYKACWLEPGATRATCTTSDLVRAIDDAVADGVDLINYSVGSLETELDAPDDLALLDALNAGVLTVVAAGNDGPELDTIGSPSSAPWVLTTAASTQDGEFFDSGIEITAPRDLASSIVMREASFTPPLTRDDAIEERLIAADDGVATRPGTAGGSVRDACGPLVNSNEMEGRIALVERGGCEFQIKIANAEDAGAVAVVVYDNTGPPIVMNGDSGSVDIPAVMIGNSDGQKFVDRLAADAEDDELESEDEQLTVRLASGARGHGRRSAAQGSASDVVAERDQIGVDDHDLRRGRPLGRLGRRRVRYGRRAHRPEPRRRPRPRVRQLVRRPRRVFVRPEGSAVPRGRLRRAHGRGAHELGRRSESAIDRHRAAHQRRRRAPSRHECRAAREIHGRGHSAAGLQRHRRAGHARARHWRDGRVRRAVRGQRRGPRRVVVRRARVDRCHASRREPNRRKARHGATAA